MSTTLVFVEHQDGQIKRSSQELLQFAAKNNQKTLALVLGAQGPALVAACAANGAAEVHLFQDAKLEQYNSELYLAALSAAFEKIKPDFILASSSSIGRDLFPRLAARLGAGTGCQASEFTSRAKA